MTARERLTLKSKDWSYPSAIESTNYSGSKSKYEGDEASLRSRITSRAMSWNAFALI